MENFQRKARPVAGGHVTEAFSATMTYASVVSGESVRIALGLAALNDLEVKTADIENAYLTGLIGEKIWCTLGPEFGEDDGKHAIMVRALYGLKSSGAPIATILLIACATKDGNHARQTTMFGSNPKSERIVGTNTMPIVYSMLTTF
jgi:hypothetical protein